MRPARASTDPPWKVFGVALGGATGQLPINVMRENVFTSFPVPDNSAGPTFAHLNTVVQVEMVQVKRLDDAMDEVRGGSGGPVPPSAR